MSSRRYPQPTAVVQMVYEKVSDRLLRSYPIKDLPLNIRPGMIFATAAWLLLLGILGMAPLPDLPVNDKALHFFGMPKLGFATFLLYFVIEVPEGPARRVWYIRKAPLLLAFSVGCVFGGIISEFIQGLLPWKEFQWGDIAANLFGSALFLYGAHLLHLRSRRRQELSTFYQPLSAHHTAVYRDAQGRQHAFDGVSAASPAPNSVEQNRVGGRHTRSGSNIWEEGSDRNSLDNDRDQRGSNTVFELGDEEDETLGQGYDRSDKSNV